MYVAWTQIPERLSEGEKVTEYIEVLLSNLKITYIVQGRYYITKKNHWNESK